MPGSAVHAGVAADVADVTVGGAVGQAVGGALGRAATMDVEPIDRRLVHRVAMSEVYLTGSGVLGPDDYTVHAQWPRRHHFFSPERRGGDLVLAAETLRQAVILTAHRYYDVPLDHAFSMRGLSVELTGAGGGHALVPAEIDIRVGIDGVRSGSRGVTSFRAHLTFVHEGVVVARGTGDLQVLDSRLYARMRPTAVRSDALAPSSPMRRGVRLVPVASGTRPTWLVDMDLEHPVFFDHPLDHVPGMLVIEAARQAVDAVRGESGLSSSSFEGTFLSYLELDRPVLVSHVPGDGAGPPDDVLLAVHQDDRLAAELRLR
jgi:hypothetical protein